MGFGPRIAVLDQRELLENVGKALVNAMVATHELPDAAFNGQITAETAFMGDEAQIAAADPSSTKHALCIRFATPDAATSFRQQLQEVCASNGVTISSGLEMQAAGLSATAATDMVIYADGNPDEAKRKLYDALMLKLIETTGREAAVAALKHEYGLAIDPAALSVSAMKKNRKISLDFNGSGDVTAQIVASITAIPNNTYLGVGKESDSAISAFSPSRLLDSLNAWREKNTLARIEIGSTAVSRYSG